MTTIETQKGKFIVFDTEIETRPFHMFVQQYGCNYIKISEITEEEASEIVDSVTEYSVVCFRDYSSERALEVYDANITPLQSLNSLLESHNIEITNNTYIFKV